jgi:gamma-glutamylcyclotransferase (GGCT)/AIG2-like uncharacterized protein YtfP
MKKGNVHHKLPQHTRTYASDFDYADDLDVLDQAAWDALLDTKPETKSDEPKDINVFVYGTLRTHAGNWSWALKPQVGTPDAVHGFILYDTFHGGFPVASPGRQHDYVIGETFKVDAKTFEVLDNLEGYPHHYDRKSVVTENGEIAWIYFQNSPACKNKIRSGDWLKHVGEPLFVYGTLKTRHSNWFHYMQPQIGKPATVEGWTLYNANGTARMAPDDSGNAVTGEIFYMYPNALPALDSHEGYSTKRKKTMNVYNRIRVTTTEGESVWCYVDEQAQDFYPHYGNDWTEHVCPTCGERAKRVFDEKHFHVYAHELTGRTATVWCRVAKEKNAKN